MIIDDYVEYKFIDKIKCFSQNSLTDDAAIIGNKVYTTDILVENTHFTKQLSYRDLGYRALAVNLSDIAAMGAIPQYFFVSLVLPKNTTEKQIGELYQGFNPLIKKYHLSLQGGDLTTGPLRVINILVVGVKHQRFLTRATMQLGDIVYSSGKLGGAKLANYTNVVKPRIKEGLQLSTIKTVHSCLDNSDGLAKSIIDLTRASGKGIRVERIPVKKGATIDDALYGGEDYELLFTATATTKIPFRCYKIGVVVPVAQATVFPKKGFEHFKR